jgi:hypothetical protein
MIIVAVLDQGNPVLLPLPGLYSWLSLVSPYPHLPSS